jgi:O-antigen/teichoic acid export membrane protein
MLRANYNYHKETIYNFLWRGAQIFGKQAISFFIFIFCVTLLSPDDFGVYSYVMGFIYLLVVFSDFGIGQTVLRNVAMSDPEDTKIKEKILYHSGLFVIFSSIIVCVGALIIGKIFFTEYFRYIIHVLPLIFLIPLTSLYDGFFGGMKKFKEQSLIFLKTSLVSAPIIVICVWYGGIIGALVAHVVFYLLLLSGLGYRYRTFERAYDSQMFRHLFSYTLLIGLTSVSYLLYTKVNVIILGWLGFVPQIGYYEIMNKIFYIGLLLPINILATITAPNISRYFSIGQFTIIREKILRMLVIIFFIGIIMSVCAYVVFPHLFVLVLPQYDSELLVSLLKIMVFLVPVKLVSTYVNTAYIIPCGYAKILTYTTIIFGIINVILSIIFLRYLGFIGIMYAMVVAQGLDSIVSTVIFLWRLYKK